ncbi:MAG TPA: hypothetical protein VI504_13130 [Candidatus Eisenbacteria bacterium]|jgi:hypothetical protein
MITHLVQRSSMLAFVLWLVASTAGAEPHAHAAPADTSTHAPMPAMHHHDRAGMDMAGMDMSHASHAAMHGMYGPYPMTREASGTAWQPDAAEHRGLHVPHGEWTLMLHGMANLVQDHQGGPRGADKLFADNMLMAMAQRPLGAATLGLRAMLSAEPATIGKGGYPLLLQTGETADGRTPLVDRQHPHDLFMELAASLSVARGDRSVFVYGGLPGEPALGPPAFMHRYSGMNLPAAPITHHWLDSTHISYGVLTLGAIADRLKLEGSAFRGREPDEHRWNLESPKLDSYALRISLNPTSAWALQASHGRLESPEQLEPGVDQERTTASAIHERRWEGGRCGAMLAWGRDRNRPGRTLDAFLLEASAELHERHTLFARAERAKKDELFTAPDPRAGATFDVGALAAGYRYDFRHGPHIATGVGVQAALALVPGELREAYGRHPTSVLVFMHGALR